MTAYSNSQTSRKANRAGSFAERKIKQHAALWLLRGIGHLVKTEPKRSPKGEYIAKGPCDFIGSINGRAVALEVKSANRKWLQSNKRHAVKRHQLQSLLHFARTGAYAAILVYERNGIKGQWLLCEVSTRDAVVPDRSTDRWREIDLDDLPKIVGGYND